MVHETGNFRSTFVTVRSGHLFYRLICGSGEEHPRRNGAQTLTSPNGPLVRTRGEDGGSRWS